MTDSGLRTVDYASGWSNRVDVAVRRALMTGFNQVVAKVNEDNAEQLGTEYFEVSYHRGARPTHQVWQGRVYSKRSLKPSADWVRSQDFAVRIAITAIRRLSRVLTSRHTVMKNLTV